MLNNVCIMGRLTRPPEVRVTASGYKRKAVEVIVNTADFSGSKKNGTNTAIEIPPPEEVFGKDDNDLPF